MFNYKEDVKQGFSSDRNQLRVKQQGVATEQRRACQGVPGPLREAAHPEITCRISELRLEGIFVLLFLIILDHLHSKNNEIRKQ